MKDRFADIFRGTINSIHSESGMSPTRGLRSRSSDGPYSRVGQSASSVESGQSYLPSHLENPGTHVPSSHVNWSSRHSGPPRGHAEVRVYSYLISVYT